MQKIGAKMVSKNLTTKQKDDLFDIIVNEQDFFIRVIASDE